MENNCPGCKNQCPPEDLKCPKGRAIMGSRQDPSTMTIEERIIIMMRKFGHHLHHNHGDGSNPAELLAALSQEEKEQLEALLKKCAQEL